MNPSSRINKLKQAAKDAPCMNCGIIDGTIVAAHRNEGKGIGIKNKDHLVAYLCHKCHHELDNGKLMTRDERRAFWNEAYVKTVNYWFSIGILRVT